MTQRGYSMAGTSGQVDEAALRYESVLESLITYASLEGRVDRISLEMNRTRRRVNALEHLVIPRLVRTMRYIEFRLEEREREDLFRRKRMKQNMERKERGGDQTSNLL
jgi:V/A-type H+-transporting ATPase subunit D